MRRRKRTSDGEELIGMLSWFFTLVPPWVCLPVAVVGLFLIPALLTAQMSTPLLKPMGQILGWGLGAMWAMMWLAGGIGGWWKRRQESVFLRANIDIAWLNGMSWQEFERRVAAVYRQRGFGVEETGGGGSDGGIDLILTGNGQTTLVQCKQWRAFKVGVKPVRELYGVMAAEGVQQGIVITSGVFTDDALRFAEGKPLELIGGAQCVQLVRESQQAMGGTAGRTALERGGVAATQAAVSATPFCPVCGSSMVLRLAKRGSRAGQNFWGCAQWRKTKCPGNVNLDGV